MICPLAKECMSPQKLVEVRKALPQSHCRGWGPANTLTLDFRSSELGGKFRLLSATRQVELCYSHLRRLMQLMRRSLHLDRHEHANCPHLFRGCRGGRQGWAGLPGVQPAWEPGDSGPRPEQRAIPSLITVSTPPQLSHQGRKNAH